MQISNIQSAVRQISSSPTGIANSYLLWLTPALAQCRFVPLIKTITIKSKKMKQKTRLIGYLVFMTLLISATLFLARSAGNDSCPICNHSIATEVLYQHPTISINK